MACALALEDIFLEAIGTLARGVGGALPLNEALHRKISGSLLKLKNRV